VTGWSIVGNASTRLTEWLKKPTVLILFLCLFLFWHAMTSRVCSYLCPTTQAIQSSKWVCITKTWHDAHD